MKTPRNLSAQELIKILARYGYEVTGKREAISGWLNIRIMALIM